MARGSVGHQKRDKLNFLIDTGSSSTVVDVSVARKLRLARSARKICVFESTQLSKKPCSPSLQLGALQAAPLPVVVQDLSPLQEVFSVRIDAVVGIDVLSRSSFSMDYEGINHDPRTLAAELESKITPQDRAEWDKGSIEDWVLEGHRLAQTVAYEDLGSGNPAVISPEYERRADPVIELQLEKAGVRLAYVLNESLR